MSARVQAAIQPGESDQCAVRRPGYTTGFGANRLPCTREAGHAGTHRDAFRREFTNEDRGPSPVYRVRPDETNAIKDAANSVTSTDVPTADTIEPEGDAMPNAREIAPTELASLRAAGWTAEDLREHFGASVRLSDVDAHAATLAELLLSPCPDADVPARLAEADRAFGVLDAHMRAGGALPLAWEEAEDVVETDAVTTAYDELSSVLRTRPEDGPGPLRDAMDAARAEWVTMDSLLADGAPLPDPWKRDA